MNGGSVERHVSIASRNVDGSVTHVTHASVRVTSEERFDPETCCDERERALIAAMRAYLRPEQAPERLLERLRTTLDHCCGE
ncbi:hypothetical protein [Bifidobacterium moukalabense]|uniref:hypothetical protein n=1 Tax=Bifidobacterium moukalabense TaxID=1333651 RepID=UPI0010F6AAA5|nr:hypothetical protein [Bifidobacterium moukalabense]